jgi:amidase
MSMRCVLAAVMLATATGAVAGTAEENTTAAIARIATLDPAIHAVIAVDPTALDQARALDRMRRARGPLFGMPVLIKDNIETAGPLPTTAGSLALAGNVTGRDAPLVASLRAAGAVILGKTNLSEWANIRSSASISGWSAVGGLTRNPYALDRNACGSSSGSGAAVASGMVDAAIGTETDGSITCPASVNGIVGLKPTVGLVSRTHVVPISHSQDTPGPMTRNVRTAALVLAAIAGSDPADPATAAADAHRDDYAARLRPDALKGARIGVMRFVGGWQAPVQARFEAALGVLRAHGATLVDIAELKDRDKIGPAEGIVLSVELKADLNSYLATTPPAVMTRTLADVIAFNRSDPRELALFGQDLFEKAEVTMGLADPAYIEARAVSLRLAGRDGIDAMLSKYNVVALVAPTMPPAWMTDSVNGDQGGVSGPADLAAVAGYPHLTVPMGTVRGMPVGLSFIGPAWSEAKLLAFGYAYEVAYAARGRPRLLPSIEDGSDIAPLLLPYRKPGAIHSK